MKAMTKKSQLFVALLACMFFANTAAARSVVIDNTGDDEMVITVQAEICPGKGMKKEDVQKFIDKHKDEVTRIWNVCNRKFRLTKGAKKKKVRIVFEFTVLEDCDKKRDPNKHRFTLHPGKPSSKSGKNADVHNLWSKNTSRSFAHEMGHVMGLDEEYANTPNGPTRENIMGKGGYKKVLPYHLMTIIFMNADSIIKKKDKKKGEKDDDEDEDDEAAKKKKADEEAEKAKQAKKARDRRRRMKTLLRMDDQETARKIAASNGITEAQYDEYKELIDINNSQIQPGRPK